MLATTQREQESRPQIDLRGGPAAGLRLLRQRTAGDPLIGVVEPLQPSPEGRWSAS
jgi:hypothetical protein